MRRAVALLVVLAACGGGGGDEPSDDAARTTTSTVVATTSTDGAVATTTTTIAATSTTTPTSAVTSDAPAPLAAGTYRYRQTGRATAGPQSFDAPPEGTAVVEPATGGEQLIRRYVDPAGEPADARVRYGADGIFILETVLRQGGVEIRCVFDPPFASTAWPPAVGNVSEGHGECDSFTTDVVARITGRTPVTIDGQSFNAYVLESTVTTEGQVTSTTDQVDWFVAELRMSAHTESQTKGSFGEIAFESTSTADLVSARPE